MVSLLSFSSHFICQLSVTLFGWERSDLQFYLTGDCGSALLSGSGGFVVGFGSNAVAGKMVVCSVTCCSLRFSELVTSLMKPCL